MMRHFGICVTQCTESAGSDQLPGEIRQGGNINLTAIGSHERLVVHRLCLGSPMAKSQVD